jgi:hypothetical protein
MNDIDIIKEAESALDLSASNAPPGRDKRIVPPVYPEAWTIKDEVGEVTDSGIVYRFTLPEFLNYIEKDRLRENDSDSPRGTVITAKSCGKIFATWDDAMRKARFGWPEMTAKCAEISGRIDDRLRKFAPKIEQVYEVYGGYPDVGRFLSGEPENMIHKQESEAKFSPSNRIVKVMLDVDAGAMGHSHEQAQARGAVTMAAIDAIERTGRRAEVWISSGFRRRTTVMIEVQIKAANQPLDLDALAFFTCAQDAESRFMFQAAFNMGFDNFGGHGAVDEGDLYVGYFPTLAAEDPVAMMQATLALLKKHGFDLEAD